MPNPSNPYPHEIAFDQHVWLPRANQKYISLADVPDDRNRLQAMIEDLFPEARLPVTEHKPAVEEFLLAKLSHQEKAAAAEKCAEIGYGDAPYQVIGAATHFFPQMREKLGTSAENPPDHVHRMQRDRCYYGDVYSSNMLISTLGKRNFSFEPAKSYLDFGCSSGSLIRILKLLYPDSAFCGADPLESAIEWARDNISGVDFVRSNLCPPLPFQNGSFDGATAVSIWSHFGESEAISWFDEMARVIKPGGWLCFTTHGRTSISHYNKNAIYVERRVRALLEGMLNSDFVFEEIYLGASPEGIDATGYGNAFFAREWLLRNLADKWDFVSLDMGLNQGNQDIYLLSRRG